MTAISPVSSRRVLADALPGTEGILRDAVLVAAGTAFVAGLAQVTVPLWPVPITGQTLAVVIVGAALGARRGALALSLYLVLGIAGLPIFAAFSGGTEQLTNPSFGFVIGFIPAAALVGWLAERNWDRRIWLAVPAFVVASAVPFLFGLPWLAVSLGHLGLPDDLNSVLVAGFYPFVIGGLVKAVVGAVAVPLAWRGVRRVDRRG
jgi:biotin transport system substrate-specific component